LPLLYFMDETPCPISRHRATWFQDIVAVFAPCYFQPLLCFCCSERSVGHLGWAWEKKDLTDFLGYLLAALIGAIAGYAIRVRIEIAGRRKTSVTTQKNNIVGGDQAGRDIKECYIT